MRTSPLVPLLPANQPVPTSLSTDMAGEAGKKIRDALFANEGRVLLAISAVLLLAFLCIAGTTALLIAQAMPSLVQAGPRPRQGAASDIPRLHAADLSAAERTMQEEREQAERSRQRIEYQQRQDEQRQQLLRQESERIMIEAVKQMKGKGPAILRVAHPTATYRGIELKGNTLLPDGGKRLTFDMEYVSGFLEATCYLEMHVDFDSAGEFRTMEWGRDTGIIPPGWVAGMAVSLIAEALKDK